MKYDQTSLICGSLRTLPCSVYFISFYFYSEKFVKIWLIFMKIMSQALFSQCKILYFEFTLLWDEICPGVFVRSTHISLSQIISMSFTFCVFVTCSSVRFWAWWSWGRCWTWSSRSMTWPGWTTSCLKRTRRRRRMRRKRKRRKKPKWMNTTAMKR